METTELKIWNSVTGSMDIATLTFDQQVQGFVEVCIPGGEKRLARKGDLFSSLTDIRKELEKDNLFILCEGSRRDVAPSGMSRQMGGGRRSYRLALGRQALRSDLVDIFDPINESEVSTVAEQKDFYINWVKSLG